MPRVMMGRKCYGCFDADGRSLDKGIRQRWGRLLNDPGTVQELVWVAKL